MNDQFRKLRADAAEAELKARSAKSAMDLAIRQCRHNYGDPKYDPKIIPGGHDPGDPPGVGGSDHRFPHSWPETQVPRWSRTCLTCGHVDYTSQTHEEPSTKKPKFQ